MSGRNAIALEVFSGGRKIENVSLERPIITIGKLSNATVRLSDSKVSRKHCVIERRVDGRWRITDLGSTHGTMVNGKRVVQTMLSEGDRVVLGDSQLKVRFPDAPQEIHAEPGPPPVPRADCVVAGSPDEASGDTLELAFLWGDTVLAVDHLDKPTGVLIGDTPGCRFTIPQEVLGSASFALIEEIGGDFVLNLSNPALQGDVLRDGRRVEGFEELRDKHPNGRLRLVPGVRARIELGEFRILVRRGARASLKRSSRWTGRDYRPWAFVCASGIVHAAFLLLLGYLPEEQLRSNLDPADRHARMVQIRKLVRAQQPKPEPKDKERVKPDRAKPELDPDLRVQPAAASALKRPDAKSETLISKLARRRRAGKKRSGVVAGKKRRSSVEIARTAGLAKVLNESSKLDDLLAADRKVTGFGFKQLASHGPGDIAVSLDPFGGNNDLLGPTGGLVPTDSVGDPTCSGPDCTESDRLVDIASGPRRDYLKEGMKSTEIKIRAIPKTSDGKVRGGRKKADVDKKIRRLMGGIRGCYQSALQLNPKLTGRVTLRFAIPPNGRVTSIEVSSQNIVNPTMMACIKRKVQRWRFGDIGAGAVARVTYPLFFKTSQSGIR